MVRGPVIAGTRFQELWHRGVQVAGVSKLQGCSWCRGVGRKVAVDKCEVLMNQSGLNGGGGDGVGIDCMGG